MRPGAAWDDVDVPALSGRHHALLLEVTEARRPQLAGLVATRDLAELTDAQRTDLRHMLTDELVAAGLGDDDEPNERGFVIEDLIDLLAPWHFSG